MVRIKQIMILGLLLMTFLIGCTASEWEANDRAADEPRIESNEARATLPVQTESNNQGTDNRIAIVETSKGTISFELFEERAPITTENFIMLVESGFYDGLTFHRVEPGFVVQGGDPDGDGRGGSEQTIPLEIHPELRHVKGAVAMARTPDPNSASSQFYITLAPTPFLDDNYAVFGIVHQGMDIVERIAVGDVMTKVTIG